MKKGIIKKWGSTHYTSSALLLAFFMLVAPGAYANTNQDVARYGENSDRAAVNTFNNCVRTKWQAGSDPCAPPPPPVAAPQPRVVIAKAERTVYFEFNKAQITQYSQQILDSLATKLKADTQIRQARVVGFADRIGSETDNEKLSAARAEAVRDYLIARGFARMGATETRWLGETVPVTQCDNTLKRPELIECLTKDRRVEVEIDYLTEVASW